MKKQILAALAACLLVPAAQAEIKNSQDLLAGIFTRAGVKGQRALSREALVELCEAGYTQAYFLYRGAGDQTIRCSNGSLRYQSAGDFRAPENIDQILNNINQGLSDGTRTFVHCNNGAHASGFVGAVVLRTFCGMSAEDAVSYWGRTLGGYPLQEPNRTSLMNRLRRYPVRSDLELSAEEKVNFGCPR